MTRLTTDVAWSARRLVENRDQPLHVMAGAIAVAIVIAFAVSQLLGVTSNGGPLGLPGTSPDPSPEPSPGTPIVGIVDLAEETDGPASTDDGSSAGDGGEGQGAGGEGSAAGGSTAGAPIGFDSGGSILTPGVPGTPSIPGLEPGLPPGVIPTPPPGVIPTPPPGVVPTPPPGVVPTPPPTSAPTPPPTTAPTPPPNVLPECANGADDDGDTRTDFPADPGCFGLDDDTEGTFVPPPPTPQPTPQPTPPPTPEPPPPTPPPPDPTPTDSILPECADFIDNDGDGFTDLLDIGCLNGLDLTED